MKENNREMKSTPVYLTRGYCPEQDIILMRNLVLPCLSVEGGMVCFPDKAGYNMHFYETRSHLFEFTTNLVIEETSGGFVAQQDNLYEGWKTTRDQQEFPPLNLNEFNCLNTIQ